MNSEKTRFAKQIQARRIAAQKLKDEGFAVDQIAKRLKVCAGTIKQDLKKGPVLKPISRNTWKLFSIIKPSEPGLYWVTFQPVKDPAFTCDIEFLLETRNPESLYWCGPIKPPRYDHEEIEMERKLREVK